MLKAICDRDPVSGRDLASPLILSRFEGSIDGRSLVEMGRAFERERITGLARRFREARRAVIDIDSTEDSAHGQRGFSFFNAFCDSNCFPSLLAFVSVSDVPE